MKTQIDRFMAMVKIDENGCWIWTGAKNAKGYGKFRDTTHQTDTPAYAHRFSYEYKYGKIKNGLFVCHKCDNPSCVNPEHLFLGTTTDNMRDAKMKGRTRKSSLSKDTVDSIISLCGVISQKEISKKFNISQGHVSNIFLGKYKSIGDKK